MKQGWLISGSDKTIGRLQQYSSPSLFLGSKLHHLLYPSE